MDLSLYLFLIMVFSLFIGIPIAFALGLTVFICISIWGQIPFMIIFQQMYQGVDKWALLAIPMFILVGRLTLEANILDDIILLCKLIFGRLKGGLGYVNVAGSMFFGGISGSAVADVSGLGSLEIPMMEKGGFDTEYSVALTASSSVIAPIIPPSIGMVIYGSIQPVSIGALFAAGLLPGILLGLGLMGLNAIISIKRNYPIFIFKYCFKDTLKIIIKCFPALMMPIIILGGILGGIFTPTESAAIANLYAILIGFFYYKTLTIRKVLVCVRDSMIVSASVLLIVSAAHPLGWLVAMAQIPQKIASFISMLSTNPLIVLFLINLFLLMLGSMMEATANILIFAPILAPVAASVGIDPLHFGIIFILNITIGLVTPPFGMCLFVAADVGKISLEKTMKAILPMVLVLIAVLFFVTYFPIVVTYIPGLLGLH